ncbi:MAG: hypothetical protein BroJett018_26250 [Chloroflexota bacterium]|nr:MAG: hypothetical protein BroJett018_26250 [Chloroflexota bacterium]
MPTNYTPLSNGQDAIAATFNAPLTQLDAALEALVGGSKALSTPTITSFANAQHTHQNAAGGGKLTAAAFDSTGASNGYVLTANGSGGAAWQGFNGVPTGAILPFGGTSAPSGWLLCDGSAINRTTYATLFATIGTAFGVGNGSTTFNLPDLRGRFPLGKDDMNGTSANRVTAAAADTLGGSGGVEVVALTVAQLPAHNHGGVIGLAGSGASQFAGGGSQLATAASSQGNGDAHENLPPYQTFNYIIKA